MSSTVAHINDSLQKKHYMIVNILYTCLLTNDLKYNRDLPFNMTARSLT